MKIVQLLKDKEITTSVLKSFVIQITAVVLVLIANILLTRLMSVEDYGVYAFAFSIVALLSGLSTAGLSTLVLRDTAAYKSQGAFEKLKGLFKWSTQLTLRVSVIVGIRSEEHNV